MSREHAIYTQMPLKPTEAKFTPWTTPWNPNEWVKPLCGVLFEGKVMGRQRHTITDSKNQKHRYSVLSVEMTSAFKREYDAQGKEIAVHQGKTKKVSTGFLQSSYRDVTIEESGQITIPQVREMIGGTPVGSLGRKPEENVFEFWGEEDTMDKIEFFMNESVRLKTKGNTPFVEFITKLDEKSAFLTNFGGDQTTGGWTDKLMAKGKSDKKEVLPQDKLEGAGDDEWD